jgi:hypothetical protein
MEKLTINYIIIMYISKFYFCVSLLLNSDCLFLNRCGKCIPSQCQIAGQKCGYVGMS